MTHHRQTDPAPVHGASRIDRGRWTRLAGTAVGGLLLALGIRRRSLGGAAAALAGGWLVYRGFAGRSSCGRSHDPAASTGRREPGTPSGALETKRSVTVGRPADELSELWCDPETQTRIFGGTVEVTAPSADRQHWTIDGPLGWGAEWDARTVEDRPGELLRWETADGARVAGEGSVRFRPAPGDRGTEVTLQLRFDPPGGAVGDAVAARLGVVPGAIAGAALDRFKSLAETGEIPTLKRNPSARGQGDLL